MATSSVIFNLKFGLGSILSLPLFFYIPKENIDADILHVQTLLTMHSVVINTYT